MSVAPVQGENRPLPRLTIELPLLAQRRERTANMLAPGIPRSSASARSVDHRCIDDLLVDLTKLSHHKSECRAPIPSSMHRTHTTRSSMFPLFAIDRKINPLVT